MFYLLNIFNKISDFGNSVYDNVFGFMANLPGFLKGIMTVIILFFTVLGIFSLVKKSVKILIISIIIVVVIVALLVMF